MNDIYNSIFGKGTAKRYGTGMWPLYNKRPWDFDPPVGYPYPVLKDPLAVAFEAASVFEAAVWPGLSLMDTDFQLSLLEDESSAPNKIEQWFTDHLDQVAAELRRRLPAYGAERLSPTCVIAMEEGLTSYANGFYLSTVRTLLPEFESIGRGLVTDRVEKTTQKKVIEELQAALKETPLMQDDPLELTTLHLFIENKLFASCYTEADAASLGDQPNRHAELHGLASYGNLRGASFVVCSMDLLLKLSGRLLDLGWQIPPPKPAGSAPSRT